MLAVPSVDTRNLFSSCNQPRVLPSQPEISKQMLPTHSATKRPASLNPPFFHYPFASSTEDFQKQRSIQNLALELQLQQRHLQQIMTGSAPLPSSTSASFPLGTMLNVLQSTSPSTQVLLNQKSEQAEVLPQTPLSPHNSSPPSSPPSLSPPHSPTSSSVAPTSPSNSLKVSKTLKRYRTRRKFLPHQLTVLEEAYKKDPFPNSFFRSLLSVKLELPPRAIQIWYQNRRVKDRKVFKASPTRSSSLKNEEELIALVTSLQDQQKEKDAASILKDEKDDDEESDMEEEEEELDKSEKSVRSSSGRSYSLCLPSASNLPTGQPSQARSNSFSLEKAALSPTSERRRGSFCLPVGLSPSFQGINHSPKSAFNAVPAIPAFSLDKESDRKARNIQILWEGVLKGAKQLKSREEAFLRATVFGVLNELQRLLSEDAQLLEISDEYGNTPLMLAAGAGHIEVVSLFLFRGANVGRNNKAGYNSLMIALHNNQLVCAERILQKCSEKELLQKENEDGNDALLICLKKGFFHFAPALLEKGASVQSSDNQGRTPLHIAVDFNSSTLVSLLLESRASVQKKDIYGNTPLVIAAIKNNTTLLDLLLEKACLEDDERQNLRKWVSDFINEVRKEDLVCELLANKLQS